MVDVSELINSAASEPSIIEPPAPTIPQQKAQAVSIAADAKRVALGGQPDEQTFKNAAMSRVTGSGLGSANPIEKDLATLGWDEIRAKYGDETAANLASAEGTARDLAVGSRSSGQEFWDVASGVGLGVTNGLGGLGALGLSAADAQARLYGLDFHTGVYAAKKVKQLNDYVETTQSPLKQNKREFQKDWGQLDAKDNAAQYERDVAKGDNKILAGLKQIGRDTLDTLKSASSDGVMLEDLTAQAAGSLLSAGFVSKGIGFAGSKLLPLAERAGVKAAAPILSKLAPGEAAIGLGLQEAGGAYQQTAAEIAGMNFDALAKNSPYYRDLIAKGMSPEDARAQVADKAGQMGAALAAPSGVVAGKFTEGLIKHPFTSRGVSDALSKIVKEPIEEGLQGATGQLAQNYGTQTYADETKNLAEGVGQQIAQGALGGLGAAGMVQGPSLAKHSAIAAGKAAIGAANSRADAVAAKNESASPSSDTNLRAANADLVETMAAPETHQAIAEAVRSTPEEARPAAESLADRLTALGQLSPDEISTHGMSDGLKESLGGTTDRVNALLHLAQEVHDKGADTHEGLSAARELSKQLAHYEALVNSDQRAFAAIPDEHPAGQLAERYNKLGDSIASSPTVIKALQAVQNLKPEQINELVRPVTEESLKTPEGQQNIENAAALAKIAPDNANLAVNEQILEHAKNGKVQLTQDQHRALMTSVALMRASEDSVQRQKDLGHRTPLNSVSEDVLTRAGGKDDVKRSAKDYAERIFQNMRAGNTEAAKGEIENFGHFVTHMTNKADAVAQHYAQGGGDTVPFQARNPFSNQWYETTGNQRQGVTPTSPKSVEYAQRVHLEAKRVADIFNGLSKAFPELNAGERTVADLHENLQGKPSEVAQAHRKGERSYPEKFAKTEAPAPKEDASLPGSSEAKAEVKAEATPASAADVKGAEAAKTLGEGGVGSGTTTDIATTKPADDTASRKTDAAGNIVDQSGVSNAEPTFQKFHRDTGTLGIPRENMPQIRSSDHGALVNYLNARGIEHESKSIPAGDLKPTQAEYSPESVERQRVKGTGERSVLVSQDGHILDGHHQWLVGKEDGSPVKVIELKADVHTALDAMHQFPSAKPPAEGSAPTKITPKSTKEAYPNLFGTSEGKDSPVKNWFQNAFQVPKDAISHLLGEANPLLAVRRKLSAETALPSDISREFQGYLGMVPRLAQTLEERLQAKLGDVKDPKSPAANLLAGKANRWAETRVFNLVEQQADGSFRYNRPLLEQSLLAGLHWMLNTNQFRSNMDAELVSSLTGIPVDMAHSYVDMLDVGLSPVEAVRSLGSRIQSFWGLKSRNDAGIGHTDGIPQAMAAEVLKALQDTLVDGKEGLLKVQKFVVEEGTLRPLADGETTKLRTVQRLIPNLEVRDTKTGELSPLFKAPALLEKFVLTTPTDRNFYAGDAVPVAKKQMNNPMVENTPAQKAMIETAQAQPYRLSERMFNLYSAIGSKGLLDLFGGGSDLQERIDNGLVNAQHALTLDGRNTTVRSAWDALQRRVSEMQALPEGLSTAIHYAFNVSSVGRLQMLGGQTPQLSKLIREAVLPTWSTLDLQNNPDHQHFFYLALAQALGVKVHANDTQTIYEKLSDAVERKFPKSIELLQDHLSSKDGKLSRDLVGTLQGEFKAAGEDLTPVALHALMEHARWTNASETEKAKFETALYLEADGVTNGVANAIRMLTADRFTPEQLENMAKTGQFFANATTMNEYRGRDSVDLYSKAAGMHQANLDTLYRENPDLRGQMQHAWSLLSELVPGVSYEADTGSVVVDRGVTKNPMTMMIYGAGAKSVSVRLADILSRALSSKLSDVAAARKENSGLSFSELMFGPGNEEKFSRFADALNALTTNTVRRTKEGLFLAETGENRITSMDPAKFALSDGQFKALQENLLHLFVQPMRSGIEETMGASATESAKLVQRSTQVQSIVLEHQFKQRVEELQAQKAKDPNWHVTDGLSQNELTGILKDLQKQFPLIDTGKQVFFPVNTDTSELKNTSTSGLNGEFKTSPQIYGPSDAGVKGGPMLNIGMGDGSMIQHMLGALKTQGLPVFDGFNFGLDKIAEGSVQANEAAGEAWKGNSLRAVLDSFKVFNEGLDTKTLADPKLRRALAEALLPEWQRAEATPEVLKSLISEMESKLSHGADMVDARHRVIAEHQHYVDQMAGAQRPYKNEGRVLSGSFEEQAQALNARLDENAKVRHEAPQVTELSHVEAQFTPEQRQVWGLVQSVGGLNGFRVELNSDQAMSANAEGIIDFGNKVIRLRGSNPETLVHEAVHAATFGAVLAHYEGGDLGPRAKEVQGAIGRLEKLMDQFRKLDVAETLKAAPDFVDAVRAINDHLERGDAQSKAAALNEFMAWSLANKGLASTLKATPSLVQMAKDVWQQIKTIVFGAKLAPKVGQDMFSHVLFNTAIVMNEQPSIAAMSRDVSLFQNRSYGTNDRISALNEMFDRLFSQHLRTGDPVTDRRRAIDLVRTQTASTDLAKMAMAQGFYMDAQAMNAFTSTVEALALHTKLDPNALTKMDELYRHVTGQLSPDMLLDKADPDHLRAESIAQMKFDMLLGHAGTKTDAKGRSSLLPVFMGLALVDDGFRDVLRQMDLPKSAKKADGTLDAWLTNQGTAMLDKMSNKLAGQGNAKNVGDAIDALTQRMGDAALDAKSAIEQVALAPSSLTNKAEEAVVGWIEHFTDKAINKARSVKANTQSEFVKHGANLTEFIAGMLTTKNGELQADELLKSVARMERFIPLRELVGDFIGRTKSNASVYDMIKLASSMVGQVRQQFREHLPDLLGKQFSRQLEAAEWSALHQAMGKTDISALANVHAPEAVLNMLADPRARLATIRTLEGFLKNEDGQHFDLVQAKMRQLADHMTSGKTGSNLLRNAEAIAALLNEPKVARNRTAPSAAYVKAVDQLTSLYALGKLSPETQASVSSLVQSEAKGMNFMLSYLKGLRNDEMAKAEGMAKFNAYKGFIPEHQQPGVSLVIAHDSDAPKLLSKSYVRVADYVGSKAEENFGSRGYYYAPVNSRAAFSQGIIQNAAHTAGGVEIATGRSQGLTAGRITNPVEVARIAKQLHREGGTSENLLPVFNDQGKVVAFDRGVDPARLASLNGDTHMGRMMGAWHGRQVEEAIGGEFNKQLVDNVHGVYQAALRHDQKTAFVNLFDPASYGNDPVIKDAVSLMTPETRAYIKDAVGDQFMVRRDMLNDVVGYRKATIGDAWTGNTRWNQETQKQVRNMAIAAFGNKAYAHMVNAEGIWQEGVSIAKTNIVVRSVIVPLANFTSNMLQLAARGVPVTDMVRNMPRKIAEAEAYTKGRLEKIETEGLLRVAESNKDFNAQRKLKAKIQSIDDGFRRMSIWPLIEAGEFGAVSHLDVSRDDVHLMQGKLHEFITGLVDKLPTSVQNAGRYAYMTKDTALFRGLAKSVEYGDFLGKAMQYDHLVKNKGLSQKEALAKITEEYVNFDRLPGRARGYTESMGLLWFMNFKIRSTKVALAMIRENPLRALMSTAMPIHRMPWGNIGTPIQDNIVAKALQGVLGYSVGPGMMFHSPMLHPVGQLLGRI